MAGLKEELTTLAVDRGAVDARVATRERLQGPPSADPTYALPGARSVIAYAVALDRSFIPDYFGKVTRTPFKKVMYDAYQLVGAIGRELVARLERKGFSAFSPSPNGVYRRGVSTSSHLVPDFSHRYAALASGLATQGWSGNVLLPGHWSAAFYGSVLTSAELEPDDPSDEALCDKCKSCTLVCPNQFFHPRESQTVVLGGHEYTCARKGNHIRCAISCGGIAGLSTDGRWSTWSTGKVVLPEDDDALPDIWARELTDPVNARIVGHILPRSLDRSLGPGVLGRGLEETDPTCCNCALVCSGPREWRQTLVRLLHSSGEVIWQDGQEVVVNADTEKSRELLRSLKESAAIT